MSNFNTLCEHFLTAIAIPASVQPSIRSNSSNAHGFKDQGESKMLKSSLYHTAKRAQQLHELIDENGHYEEWVESKIFRAAEDLKSVLDYLEYEHVSSQETECDNSDPSIKVVPQAGEPGLN